MIVEIEKLNFYHSTLDFDCGDDEINSFFERSFEEVSNKNSQVYVITKKDRIIGFFSISMSSIRAKIDESYLKHPVALIGQLGINKPYQRKGFGSFILDIAIEKAKKISGDIGCKGVILETYKFDLVNNFYKNKGFTLLDKKNVKEKGIKYIMFYKFEK